MEEERRKKRDERERYLFSEKLLGNRKMNCLYK